MPIGCQGVWLDSGPGELGPWRRRDLCGASDFGGGYAWTEVLVGHLQLSNRLRCLWSVAGGGDRKASKLLHVIVRREQRNSNSGSYR